MSINILYINGQSNSSSLKEFICDSIDDIAKLPKYGVAGELVNPSELSINDPCAIGSTALVCKNADGVCEKYILSPSNEWIKLEYSKEPISAEGVAF